MHFPLLATVASFPALGVDFASSCYWFNKFTNGFNIRICAVVMGYIKLLCVWVQDNTYPKILKT